MVVAVSRNGTVKAEEDQENDGHESDKEEEQQDGEGRELEDKEEAVGKASEGDNREDAR